MNSPDPSYGTVRDRGASVSFTEIASAARTLLAAGDYPSVAAVRQSLGRGSQTTVGDAMRRFWKDQAALDSGNPVALTRLPPEFADAAVALWEQALRLSLQTAKAEDTAAHVKLAELKRDTEIRARSMELREKEWDIAARVRERALTDTRGQVNMLLKELGNATAEMRARDARIADLEMQLEDHRRQLATIVSRAITNTRLKSARKSSPASRGRPKGRVAVASTRSRVSRKPLKSKRKHHGKRR